MDYENLMNKYGSENNFIVYSASAGTGKTHAITREEIKHLFETKHPDFISITFTNAASKEMRERIVEYLIEMASSGNISNLMKNELYRDIIDELKNSKVRVDSAMAEEILLGILNNYSSLTISTIDSLAVKLLRAYQDKTELPLDVKILLDEEEFYDELIPESLIYDNYFAALKEQDQIEYSKQIIENTCMSKGNINTNLFKQIKDSVQDIKKFLSYDLEDSIQPEMAFDFSLIYEEIKRLKRIFDQIQKYNDYLGNDPKRALNRLKSILSKNKINFAEIELLADYSDKKMFKGCEDVAIKNKIREQYKNIRLSVAIIYILFSVYVSTMFSRLYNNFVSYYNKYKTYLSEIPLSDVYTELRKTVRDKNEIPVRFGKDFSMMLIDEFQDTSLIQFKVLSHLLDYVIDKKGKAIVVGDTKQAIYGFREGDYKMLSALIKKKENKIISLNKNFRSSEEIVRFVGNLFPTKENIEKICSTLDFKKEDKDKRDAYKDAFNDIGALDLDKIMAAKKGGYIEVNVYGIDFRRIEEGPDNEAFTSFDLEMILDDIRERITDIKKRGYSYKDICIITKKNEDVIEIASYLTRNKIPVKSYSSLDARERSISKEILALMKYSLDRENMMSLYLFLKSPLFQYKACSLGLERDYNQLLADFESNTLDFKFDKDSKLYKECFEEILSKANTLSAYDMLTLIYKTFDITTDRYKDEQAAYMTLLDAAIKLEKEEDNTIKTFIEKFDDKGNQEDFDTPDIWKMNVSESIDAVTVSTVHKMKGLGFPVVLYIVKRGSKGNSDTELAKIKIGDKTYLIKKNSDNLDALKTIEGFDKNIKYNEKDFKTDTEDAAEIINMHYVALTRAKDELYVFLYNEIAGNNVGKAGTKCILTSMIYNLFINDKRKWKQKENNILTYRTGNQKPKDSSGIKEDTIYNITNFSIPEQRQIYLKSFLNRDEQARIGTIVHNVLSKIGFVKTDSVDEAINRAISETEKEGIIVSGKDELINQLRQILLKDETKWIFEESEGRVVRNEMEFVDSDGNILRADRVIIDKDKIYVIDYKTGRPNDEEKREYRAQVKKYCKVLKDLFSKEYEGLILYVDNGEVERV